MARSQSDRVSNLRNKYSSDGVEGFESDVANLLAAGIQGNTSATAYSAADSYQPVAVDLYLAAGAGTSTASDHAYLAPIMGNVIAEGINLTKENNTIGGVIGKYSCDATVSSVYPKGGVIGIVADSADSADGAFVAVLDGDSTASVINAAFKAMTNNSVPGAGFNYGLDLYDNGGSLYPDLAILKADIRMSNQVVIMNGAGAPVDGTTGDNFAGTGSIYIDKTNGNAYLQTSAITTPVWKLITRAA